MCLTSAAVVDTPQATAGVSNVGIAANAGPIVDAPVDELEGWRDTAEQAVALVGSINRLSRADEGLINALLPGVVVGCVVTEQGLALLVSGARLTLRERRQEKAL